MRCPKCGLTNPSTAFRCVCGQSLTEGRLSELESRLAELAAQIEKVRAEIAALRQAPPEAEAPAAPETRAPERPVPPTPAPPPPGVKVAGQTLFVKRSTAPPAPRRASPEWEALIGGRWLAKIGTVALVLGILYFLKYAFDNQWIGNTGRVLIGGFSGLALLYGGERFQTKGYRLYGQTVAGGGIVVLYLSIYAAFNFYSLISQAPAVLLMALVTAVCCSLAYRYESRTLATMGLLGGLLTPYLLSTGKSNQIGLLSYLLVLDVGAGRLAGKRRWGFLNLISFAGTVILFVGWASAFYRPEDVWRTHVFLVLFAALYLGLIYDWRSRAPEWRRTDAQVAWLLDATVVFIFFEANVVLFFDEAGRFWPFVLIFSALGLGGSLWLRSSLPALVIFFLSLLGIVPWLLTGYGDADRLLTIASLTLFWIMFAVIDLWRMRWGRGATGPSSLVLALLDGLIYFGLGYFVLHDAYAGWMGLFAIGVALAHLVLANVLREGPELDAANRSLVLAQVGVAVTLTTLAIPIQLEQDWITIGWGVEAVVLVWIGTATASLRMRQAGLVVLVLCLLRLFTWTALQPLPDYTLLFNRRFLAFLAVIALISLTAVLYWKVGSGQAPRRDLGSVLHPVLVSLAMVMLATGIFVIALSQEAWTYYGHQQSDLSLDLMREQIDTTNYYRRFEALSNRRQLALSLVWGVCSILAVIAGLIRRFRPVRLFGIGLFVLTIVKVFSVDIWRLEQLYRIISTVALGGLLLGVAFLYQRFKTLIIKA